MHANDGSSERLGNAINVPLHTCVAIRELSVSTTNLKNRALYLVVHPLTNIHRSRSCCLAIATVLSSILENTSLDPCMGHAARKMATEQSMVTPINKTPGKNSTAGMANTSIDASKRESQLCNTTSLMPQMDQDDSEPWKGIMSPSRCGRLEMRVQRSWNRRRKGFFRAASVVVLVRASICGGMNLTTLAMAGEEMDFPGIAGGVFVILVS